MGFLLPTSIGERWISGTHQRPQRDGLGFPDLRFPPQIGAGGQRSRVDCLYLSNGGVVPIYHGWLDGDIFDVDLLFGMCLGMVVDGYPPPKFNSSPLKSYQNPIGK